MDIDIVLEPDLTPDQIAELGRLAEGYGFRTLWLQNYARARDAFLSAVPLARATRRLRIGIVVVSPYEMHPLKIANSILTLDEYAQGGTTIVIGAGGEWNGVMGKGYGKRITTSREALEIIKAACSGKTVNYRGDVFRAVGFNAGWHAGGAPEILSGSSGPKMLAMAASVADGVMMSDVQLPMLARHLPPLTAALRAAGKANGGFHVNNFIAWHVQADAEASYRESRREMIIRGWLERPWLEPFLSEEETELVLARKTSFLKAFRERTGDVDGIPPGIVQTLVDGLSMAGDLSSLDRHIDTLRRFGEAGFTEIALRVHDNPSDSIRLIGERVLPALR
jgi:5,10-methylenetetrahydromethanopterin reductase